jgi:hypothetical protein
LRVDSVTYLNSSKKNASFIAQALVHVSTLFANCQHHHLLEEVYPTNADPEKLINCAEWMDDAWLNILCPA